MKNTFYDKINHKKAIWIIIRNGHSKQLCDNVREILWNTSRDSKKFSKKKSRQYSRKICDDDY